MVRRRASRFRDHYQYEDGTVTLAGVDALNWIVDPPDFTVGDGI